MAPSSRTAALVAAALFSASAPALAAERFDHRGALGLLVGGGAEWKEGVSSSNAHDYGLRYDLDLGGTYAIGYDGNELMLVARAGLGSTFLDASLFGGYRGYFGQDRWKTFFDLGLSAHFTPAFAFGPRLGFGVQYELTPVIGAFVGSAVQLGFGNGLRFDAELVGGLQFRTYVLE